MRARIDGRGKPWRQRGVQALAQSTQSNYSWGGRSLTRNRRNYANVSVMELANAAPKATSPRAPHSEMWGKSIIFCITHFQIKKISAVNIFKHFTVWSCFALFDSFTLTRFPPDRSQGNGAFFCICKGGGNIDSSLGGFKLTLEILPQGPIKIHIRYTWLGPT